MILPLLYTVMYISISFVECIPELELVQIVRNDAFLLRNNKEYHATYLIKIIRLEIRFRYSLIKRMLQFRN